LTDPRIFDAKVIEEFRANDEAPPVGEFQRVLA